LYDLPHSDKLREQGEEGARQRGSKAKREQGEEELDLAVIVRQTARVSMLVAFFIPHNNGGLSLFNGANGKH